MLHLYNSCYAYPYAMFDPSSADYIVVGDKHAILGAGVENSFYYNNVIIHQCYARFKTYEDFINSNLLLPAFNNKQKFIIYCDNETLIKLFTAKLKTHIYFFDNSLYFDLAKLFGVRLKIKSKLLIVIIFTIAILLYLMNNLYLVHNWLFNFHQNLLLNFKLTTRLLLIQIISILIVRFLLLLSWNLILADNILIASF